MVVIDRGRFVKRDAGRRGNCHFVFYSGTVPVASTGGVSLSEALAGGVRHIPERGRLVRLGRENLQAR